MQSYTSVAIPLEITSLSPGKDTGCHLLSTTSETGGQAKEKEVLILAELTNCYHSMDWD